MPVRTDADATESVIEADLRGALSAYHPSAQAVVETKLAQVQAQRAQDDAVRPSVSSRQRRGGCAFRCL